VALIVKRWLQAWGRSRKRASDHAIMNQTGHRSVQMVHRYIREGTVGKAGYKYPVHSPLVRKLTSFQQPSHQPSLGWSWYLCGLETFNPPDGIEYLRRSPPLCYDRSFTLLRACRRLSL
jgi:hypothetical protein